MRYLAGVAATLAGAFLFAPHPLVAQSGPGIAADRSGRIYFVDQARERVWRLDPDGRIATAIDGKHENLIVAADDGSVWVLYRDEPIILRWVFHRIAPDGSVTEVVRQSPIPHPNGGLMMDGAGRVYFMNLSELLVLRPDSTVSVWTRPVVFNGARGAAFGPDSSLVVIDSNSIRLAHRAGGATELAGTFEPGFADGQGSAARFNRPTAAAVDSVGNTYVADFGNGRLRKITPDGTVSTVVISEEGWRPVGVTQAGGRVYLLEQTGEFDSRPDQRVTLKAGLMADVSASPRVRRIEPDGSIATVGVVRRWWALGVAVMVPITLVVGGMALRRRQRPQPVTRSTPGRTAA